MSPVRHLGVPAALACAAVLVPAGAAAAAEPERTGWWNRLSGGGLSLPAPTAQEGDLRVASAPDGPSAFSALLYTAPGSTSASLDLALREGSVLGTPVVVACPTADTGWEEGANQPYDKAPGYDCDIGSSFGQLSEDGTTLSFSLDSSTQVEPGVWSLAVVPEPGSATVFSVDLQKPGPEAFTAEPPAFDPSADSSFDDTGSPTEPGSAGSGDAFLPGGFEAPPGIDAGTAAAPPLVAGGAEAALPDAAAPAPAVAATRPPPVLLARPAGVVEDLGTGRRLLALLLLAGGSAAVGYAAGQQRPGPQLLGGRARLGAPALAVPGVPGPAQDRPRGIGRFAKPRDAAPRRLR